jgi:Fe-S oxidoreductase
VLEAAGHRVAVAWPTLGAPALCCGRTYLATGQVEKAKDEARRLLQALLPFVAKGVPVVGLQPSCLFTLRDEFLAMGLGEEAKAVCDNAFLFEEFLVREKKAGRLKLELKPLTEKTALLHGHCHQKAFGAMSAVQEALSMVPDLAVSTIESSCCGMAGSFGYEAEHYETSIAMAELSLMPAVRAPAAPDRGRRYVMPSPDRRRQQPTGACRRGAGAGSGVVALLGAHPWRS